MQPAGQKCVFDVSDFVVMEALVGGLRLLRFAIIGFYYSINLFRENILKS